MNAADLASHHEHLKQIAAEAQQLADLRFRVIQVKNAEIERLKEALRRCCECGKANEAPGPMDDWIECERCGKPLCDECVWKHPHGDDSYPYAHCSACEPAAASSAAPGVEE